MASFKRRFEAKWRRGIPIRVCRDPCERGVAVNPVSDFEGLREDIEDLAAAATFAGSHFSAGPDNIR